MSSYVPCRRRLRVVVASAVALGCAVPAVGEAAGVFTPPPVRQQYTYDGETCAKPVDPLNVVFYGRAATAENAHAAVEDVAGWRTSRGSGQWFSTGRGCSKMNSQTGSGTIFPHDRFHIRFFESRRGASSWATYGDAHKDDFSATNCQLGDSTEAPGGFDKGREKLVEEFRKDKARIRYVRWNNRRRFKQCNGEFVGSDGRVAYILTNRKR